MGTLRSTDPLCQGAVVNGVTLGEPAEDADGNPVWDDHRIPDGDVEPTAAAREDGPLPEVEQQAGAAVEVVDYDGAVPVRVRIPRPEAVAVDLVEDVAPIVKGR